MRSTRSMPDADVDRRTVVCLVVTGATIVVFTEAGIPMIRGIEGLSTLDSAQRIVASLASAYDAAGPAKIVTMMPRLERMFGTMVADRLLPAVQVRDAKAVYAQLLTMAATADDDTGDHARAARTGQLAASLATEIGDNQTAGHAWSVVASALSNGGNGRAALPATQRAHAAAGSSPSAAMALTEQAATAAKTGRADTVLRAVHAAEKEHATLPTGAWGTPGYSLGSFHAAKMGAFTGWSLAKVGMYREAAPRLDEAAESAAGTGLMVFIRLAQSRTALGTGHADSAYAFAAMAVTSAETRPAAWVDREIRELHKQSRGAFADLVEQTSRWGFTATEA
jgi:hypothetical protein